LIDRIDMHVELMALPVEHLLSVFRPLRHSANRSRRSGGRARLSSQPPAETARGTHAQISPSRGVHAALQRLAQGFKDISSKFGQLIQE